MELEIKRLHAEIARLTECLARANASSEKFEREWYLRGEVLDTAEYWLGSLLAVIHRDGGHYQTEHGTEKACADAELAVHVQRGIADGYHDAIKIWRHRAEQLAIEADAEIAGLRADAERIDAQWREELRIYREADDARIAELERERNSLRDFANDVMESWPHGDVDGCDLERMAVEHGLLALKDPKPTEPCGDNCACSGYPSPEEWAQGIDCYVRTPLLKGDAARAGNGGEV